MELLRLASRNKLIFGGFASIAGIVIAFVTIVYLCLGSMQESNRMDVHTNEVLRVESSLLTSLTNIETGQRGYLITGKEASLEPLQQGQKDYESAFASLRKLTADNPVQQKRLDAIDAGYRGWLADAIEPALALQKQASPGTSSNDAMAFERQGKGKAGMDALRGLLRDFAATESTLLDARALEAAKTHGRAIGVLLGGGAFAVLLILGVAIVLVRSVLTPLREASAVAARIAAGRLGESFAVTRKDDLGRMLNALKDMDDNLARIVGSVRDNAAQVESAAKDISAGNDDLSSRTQEQASSLEETAASMEEISSTVKQNAEGASLAKQISNDLRGDALEGSRVAGDAVEAMKQITDASRNIGEIAVLIDEIAFQTNLLALNAAVEAARAGDQGRGFAVVAAEVRNLAQRSATAAKDIKALISQTVDRIDSGADLVGRTGHALSVIQGSATRVADIVNEIAAASQEQSAGVEQVNSAVAALDDVTQQNAALVEQASASSRHALELARELTSQVAFFTVEGGDAPASRPRPAAAVEARQTVSTPKAAPASRLATAAPMGDWREF